MDSSGVFQKTSWSWTTPDGRNVFKFSLNAQIARPALISEVPEARDWSVKSLAKRKWPDPNEPKPADAGNGSPEEGAGEPGGEVAAATGGGGEPAPTKTDVPAGAVARAEPKPSPDAASPGAGDSSAKPAADGSAPLPDRGIGRRPTPDPNEAPKPPVSGGAGTGAGGGPGAAARASVAVPDTFTDEQLKAMPVAELRDKLTVFAQARRREDLDPETAARVRTDFQRIVDALKEATSK
jgi:hypothetical protein